MNNTSIRKALNKAFLKIRPAYDDLQSFKENLQILFSHINKTESEEFHKNVIVDFLKNTFYKEHFINTKGRADLVIHTGKNAQTAVGVILEVKSPTNKAEMITAENLNSKAFQELILYYFRERKTAQNFELKHLIVTNIYEWFIFDANLFEKLFYSDKELKKNFEDFENKRLAFNDTDTFYKEIAQKFIAKKKNEIEFTHFDLREYEKLLTKASNDTDQKLIPLYKIFSPTHLLKFTFASDNNYLNKEFYNELLHIIGLTENKVNGKNIIERKAKDRYYGSLIENTIDQLDASVNIAHISNLSQYGANREERLFNIALDLVITWINRILFMKLLEAQLLKYQKGNKDYSFLTPSKLKSYDEVNTLFFHVLARKSENRHGKHLEEFKHVPYLNSSLFEPTELEQETLRISNLLGGMELPIYSKSVLQQKGDNKDIEPLEYLLRFLDAYNFSSESLEVTENESKKLISASVLGLIFEKINGYKDGSFFTPSSITMYMCKETITNAVLNKFKAEKGWDCKDLKSLGNKIHDIEEANNILNSIKLCDPAVGSGHFLVSALNEMIAIKNELGILVDRKGKCLKGYTIEVVNDELHITDDEYHFFEYDPTSKESQRIQETFFHEKQTIIENCLFGVDINPNSAKICRLRLWIELLKNSYYKQGSRELETLPNIDINIKCGNSLISRFALDADLKNVLKKQNRTISDYRNAVQTYRNAESKDQKYEMEKLIHDIKNDFETEIAQNDPRKKKIATKKGERDILLNQTVLFEETKTEKKNKKQQLEKLEKEIQKLDSELDSIEKNKIYENSFEWRFEFPEVLDNEGNYQGFDIILGNPPYIQLQSMGTEADKLQQIGYQTFERTGDIYCLFYELANRILKSNGLLCFITSNKWMRAGYGQSLRNFLVNHTNPLKLIDFAGFKVFDSATVDTNILLFQKATYQQQTFACSIGKDFEKDGIEKMSDYVGQFLNPISFAENSSWVILSLIEQRIKEKIEKAGKPLKEWDVNIYRGILTGYNEAFIIDGKTKDELIAKSPKSAEIIRPNNLYCLVSQTIDY